MTDNDRDRLVAALESRVPPSNPGLERWLLRAAIERGLRNPHRVPRLASVIAACMCLAVVGAMLAPTAYRALVRYEATSSASPVHARPASPQAASVSAADRAGTPTGFFTGWFVSDQVGWVAVQDAGHGALVKTEDGGGHWTTQLTFSFPRLFQRDMRFIDAQHGFVLTLGVVGQYAQPQLFATSDGRTWEPRSIPAGTNPSISGMDFVDSNTGWLLLRFGASSDEVLYRTEDGGHSWKSLTTSSAGNPVGLDSNTHMEGMRFVDASHGWISAWRSALPAGPAPGGPVATPFFYYTADGGLTWVVQPLAAPTGIAFPTIIASVEPPHLFNGKDGMATVSIGAKGSRGLITYATADGGVSWSAGHNMPSGTESWAAVDKGHAWFGGTDLYRTGDSGLTLNRISGKPVGTVVSMDFVSSATGFAVMSDASGTTNLYKTTDGGTTWTQVALALFK